MVFLDLEGYNKERDRLIREEGMDYMDACSQAWRTTVIREKERSGVI